MTAKRPDGPTKVVAVRVSGSEKDRLQELGNGSFSKAVRTALTMLFEAQGKPKDGQQVREKFAGKRKR